MICCVYIYSRVIAIREQVRVMEHLRYVVVVLVGDSANGENKLLKWPLWFAKISRLVPKYSFALGRSLVDVANQRPLPENTRKPQDRRSEL